MTTKKGLTPQRLFQHAIDTEDWSLAALLITVGSMEILSSPLVGDLPREARAAVLQTVSLNLLQPAFARAQA